MGWYTVNLFSRLRRHVAALAGAAADTFDRVTGDRAEPSDGSAEPNDAMLGPPGRSALVTGLFDRISDAEMALTNLDEADYTPRMISVITSDPARTHTLTDHPGQFARIPLDDLLTRLGARGLSADDQAAYRTGIGAGGVLIIVDAPAGAEASAGEILTDQKARQVRILPATGGGA